MRLRGAGVGGCKHPHGGAALGGLLDLNVWLALALAHGWRLVSFDADFQRYPALNWLRLLSPAHSDSG